jgi:hypothetical protein
MAKSLYKGERLGKRPPCAICMGAGVGERAELRLPCGVSVWLCEAHRSDEFQRRRAGRDFVATLMHVWSAAGCMNRRRHRALDLHRRNVLAAVAARSLPGSYAWPDLRREAERLFADGVPVAVVTARIRARGTGDVRPPSESTVYRWHAEARWRSSLA